MHDQLSEVLSLEQSDEGIGSPFETFHDILAVFRDGRRRSPPGIEAEKNLRLGRRL
jgi:hypothetical protein